MVNFPNQKELKELRSFRQPHSLTIYASYIEPNGATNPNRIELKNLLREAETALLSSGVEPRAIKKTLKPARSLLNDDEFWPIRHENLALFMHPELFRYYHVAGHAMPTMLTVEDSFNLDPLAEAMKDNQQYYVLALSHNHVRLFEGDHYHIRPLRLKNFPVNMKEALGIDEDPQSTQARPVAHAKIDKGPQPFHGQYNETQVDKDRLHEFFRRIDRRLYHFLSYRRRPLIIAGVQYLLPIYRDVNSYPGLLDEPITGNQERADPQAIRKKAWSLVGNH